MALPTADRLDILELYARYSQAVDAMDGDAWISCWVADGEFSPSVGHGRTALHRACRTP